jgi:N5-(cytidine 5'-diphosphoramidyl)-L-glutamine hydrolase
MKKIFITQRIDKIGKFNEVRDNLDIRFQSILTKLKMIPIIIPNNFYLTKKILKVIKANGIILSPGGDPRKKDERYKSELLLISYAKKNNVPLLGICRGAQALNIYFGGKIKKMKNHVRKSHELKGVLSKKKINSNCFHDYGINKECLGKNLEILAYTKDESIECFKHKKKQIMGIMWHPERFKKFRSFEMKIIKKFF